MIKYPLKKHIRRFFFKPLLTKRAERLMPHILDSVKGCETMLDFGGGDMVLVETIKNKSDISIVAIDTIDTNLTAMPLQMYDGERIPFPDKSFDVTLVSFVLHHCNDPSAVLAEIKRVTKKKIIIMEEIFQGGFAKKILHLHDLGNRFLSTKMNIPNNFLNRACWEELFSVHKLKILYAKRVYQYPILNLTNQIYFELAI